MLVMVASKDPDVEEPGPDDLYDVGVVGVVARMLKVPDGSLRIIVQGTQRVALKGFVATEPYLIAQIEEAPDVLEPSPELEALTRNVQSTFSQIIEQTPYLPEELSVALANIDDPSELAHLIAGALRIRVEEKQELLEERDVAKRLRLLSQLLTRELEVISLGSKIQSQVQSEMDKTQREYFLRQQMKAIQGELGEVDETQAEVNELREQVEAADLPEHVREVADRELARFERLPPQSPEHGVIRGYLEWILSLPWSTSTPDDLDLKKARRVLDHDHYDIEKVKDRILEFLAVRKLKPDARSSILCFVGPPGVGKTSLGRSIAAAMGRKFERISVGGVRDESEIRGHRRTYVGALPGTIIRALRDAGSNNPVLIIDEIDKMGADFRGDPASAMLEVLDPEQNATFRDHYLDLPFDLSQRPLHHHRQPARPDPGAAARSHGDHRAVRLHGARRSSRSPSATSCRARSSATAYADARSSSPTTRSARSSTATRARPACATSSGRSARSAARSRAGTPTARAPASGRSVPARCASCSASAASTTRSRSARASRAWPPGWR